MHTVSLIHTIFVWGEPNVKVEQLEVYIREVCEHLSSSQLKDIQGMEEREPLQNTHFNHNLELRARSRVALWQLLRCQNVLMPR